MFILFLCYADVQYIKIKRVDNLPLSTSAHYIVYYCKLNNQEINKSLKYDQK